MSSLPLPIGEQTEVTVLPRGNAAHLAAIEEAMEQADRQQFVVHGRGLSEVKSLALWASQYSTFEEYCRQRWQYTGRRADQLIDCWRAIHNLGTQVPRLPAHEKQVRQLLSLDADKRRAAWQFVLETAPDGHLTTKHVEWAVARFREGQDEAPATLPAAPDGEDAEPDYVTLSEWESLPHEAALSMLSETKNPAARLNQQKNRSIEWAQWSWNPVTGCRHDCPYCYARDIAARFYAQGFEPTILPRRLDAPKNTPVPGAAEEDIAYRNVFTCSMADLFGRWVPPAWIWAVLQRVAENPQWNFLFLTKFPKRLAEFDYPANAWLGTTVDCQARVKNAEDAFARLGGGIKWLSVEPMLEPLKFTRLDLFDWVVIGGASESTQTPAWVPPLDWIFDLHAQARAAGCRVYYKDNTGLPDALRLREFPWGDPPKQRELPPAFHYLQGLG